MIETAIYTRDDGIVDWRYCRTRNPEADFVVADSEVEWILHSGAEIQTFQRQPLNEALRFSIPRKPGRPSLHRHSTGVACATVPPRIHQQISKPPRPATVRKSETKKPDFVTAPGGE
jgi:hypothetical protein